MICKVTKKTVCNGTRTQNHLGRKRTLNHLAKLASLAKWLSVRLRTKWCGFESRGSHLNFRYCACFEQGVPSHSGKYRVRIHSETHTWHNKNIQTQKKHWFICVCLCQKTYTWSHTNFVVASRCYDRVSCFGNLLRTESQRHASIDNVHFAHAGEKQFCHFFKLF